MTHLNRVYLNCRILFRPNYLRRSLFSNAKFLSTGKMIMEDKYDDDKTEEGVSINESAHRKPVFKHYHEEDIFSDPTLSEADKKKLKVYQREYEVWKYADSYIPDYVTNEQWKTILQIDNSSGRLKYYTFLYSKAIDVAADERRQLKRKQEAQQRREEREASYDGHIIYAIGHNAFFRRLEWGDIVKAVRYPRLVGAMMHGPHLVFDTSFLNTMTIFQQGLTVKQLRITIDEIKLHKQPIHAIFTGANFNTHWYKEFSKLYLDKIPITVTEKCYTDLFPKKKLIYLSPTARDTLKTVDLDKVHIIGAIVDKGEKSNDLTNATLGKSKAEKIACYKLPLDNYVKFQRGSKHLCVNHITRILLDYSVHKNWHQAFLDNIPSRKFTPPTELGTESQKRHKNSMIERTSFLTNMTASQENEKK